MIIGGVNVTTTDRYDTQLIVEASRTGRLALFSGAQIRPVPIPITLYVEQATNDVRYCAGNDETQACSQIGGNYVPGDPKQWNASQL